MGNDDGDGDVNEKSKRSNRFIVRYPKSRVCYNGGKGGDCRKTWESVEAISREAVLGDRLRQKVARKCIPYQMGR